MRPYLQRILDHSNATRGYQIEDLEAKADEGIPTILETRTYPKCGAWEQSNEDKPWYTRTGRLEFYRDEQEFLDSGENMVIHREPIDSTFYEPNVIVADADHPLLRPKTPEDYGVDPADVSGDARQARHVIRSVDELLQTEHPLAKYGYDFIFHTPKYRHGAHTTAVDTDVVAIWFGPFGDMNREDKRMPLIDEMYVDMHPLDAKELGIEDGDYVWIDADPQDRPFHGWQKNKPLVQGGPPDGARPLLPWHAAGCHPDVAQHVRCDLRLGARNRGQSQRDGQSPDDGLPVDVPHGQPPKLHPRLPQADLDDRYAERQRSAEPGHDPGIRAGRALSDRRAARIDGENQPGRTRAASRGKACGDRPVSVCDRPTNRIS